jgi:hypothetical protein
MQFSKYCLQPSSLFVSPVHVAPACIGSDHFGSYVRSISLHFYKRLFPGLEPMTSWSQGNDHLKVVNNEHWLVGKIAKTSFSGTSHICGRLGSSRVAVLSTGH